MNKPEYCKLQKNQNFICRYRTHTRLACLRHRGREAWKGLGVWTGQENDRAGRLWPRRGWPMEEGRQGGGEAIEQRAGRAPETSSHPARRHWYSREQRECRRLHDASRESSARIERPLVPHAGSADRIQDDGVSAALPAATICYCSMLPHASVPIRLHRLPSVQRNGVLATERTREALSVVSV